MLNHFFSSRKKMAPPLFRKKTQKCEGLNQKIIRFQPVNKMYKCVNLDFFSFRIRCPSSSSLFPFNSGAGGCEEWAGGVHHFSRRRLVHTDTLGAQACYTHWRIDNDAIAFSLFSRATGTHKDQIEMTSQINNSHLHVCKKKKKW